jgi:hypothetical protein
MKLGTDKTESKKTKKKEIKKVEPKKTVVKNGRVLGAGNVIKE